MYSTYQNICTLLKSFNKAHYHRRKVKSQQISLVEVNEIKHTYIKKRYCYLYTTKDTGTETDSFID